MPNLPRIQITLTPALVTILQKEATKRGITQSRVAYEFLVEGLRIKGHDVATEPITWGGKRKRKKKGKRDARTETAE